jgi:hypothetical protein
MYCPLTTWFATSNSSDRALDEFVIEDITTTIPLHPRLFAARVSSPMRYEIGGIASGECPNV